MCESISFFVGDEKLACAHPSSHSGTQELLNLKLTQSEKWSEAEWTADGKLVVRGTSRADCAARKAWILSKWPTRADMITHLRPRWEEHGNYLVESAEDAARLPAVIVRHLVCTCAGVSLKHVQSVGGDLYLSRLTSAEGLTLPQSVGGDLDLSRLTSAEGLTLPQSVGGNLDLRSLTSAEGLTLSQSVGGSLYLMSLTSAEGLTLSQSVGGSLYLSRLTSAEGLTLSQSVGGSLYLSRLTSAEAAAIRKKLKK